MTATEGRILKLASELGVSLGKANYCLKAHIGVDRNTRLVHSASVTAANVHDSQLLSDLLHGEETRVWGDSAYTGQTEVLVEFPPTRRISRTPGPVATRR